MKSRDRAVGCSGEFYRVPKRDLIALLALAHSLSAEVDRLNEDTPSYLEAQRYAAETIARVRQHMPPDSRR